MIKFETQVERLARRQQFELRMTGRPDILDPQGGASPGADRIAEHLVSGIDYARDEDAGALLPRGLRLARYSQSPLIQARIDANGHFAGNVLARAPQSVEDTDALVRGWCPIPATHYSEMRRILYVDPPAYARLLEPLRRARPEIVTLLFNREYELALQRCPELDLPAGVKNYDGSLIQIARTFGELDRVDDLAAGLHEQSLDVKTLRKVLGNQDMLLDHIARRTPAGEFLIGLLAHPDLLDRHRCDPALRAIPEPFAPWALGKGSLRQLRAVLERRPAFEAFARFVLGLDFLQPVGDVRPRIQNRLLATYFGLQIDQFLLAAMIALGRSVIMERNEEPHQRRETAMGSLVDALLRRHEPELADAAKARRDAQVEKMAGRYGWDPEFTEHGGASRNQRFRDVVSLMTPGPDLPGHGSGIDPDMWKVRHPDEALWRALLATPPTPEWLAAHDIDPAAIAVFEQIRAAQEQMAGLFKPKTNSGRIRLAADLSTAIGPLTGHASYRDRLFGLVDNAAGLREAGLLENRRGVGKGRTIARQKISARAGNRTMVKRG